jgi:hypothetical protein
MCQYDMAKKSYEPITRFFVRGSFSFIDLIEKEKTHISPELLDIYCFFKVNLDPDLALLD